METRNVAVPERENGMPVSTTDPCEDIQSTTIALHGAPLRQLKLAAQDRHLVEGTEKENGETKIMSTLGLKVQASQGYRIVELEMGRKKCDQGIVFTTITRIKQRGNNVVSSYMQHTVITDVQERNNFQKIFDLMDTQYTLWHETRLQDVQKKVGPEYQVVHGTKADRD